MIAKKMEHEVCGYWPNSSCAGRVVGYSIDESQKDDKRVALCFAHFQDTQLDNLTWKRKRGAALLTTTQVVAQTVAQNRANRAREANGRRQPQDLSP